MGRKGGVTPTGAAGAAARTLRNAKVSDLNADGALLLPEQGRRGIRGGGIHAGIHETAAIERRLIEARPAQSAVNAALVNDSVSGESVGRLARGECSKLSRFPGAARAR